MLPVTNKYVWIGAAAGLLVAAYLAKKTVDIVDDVADKVNPFNPDNVINKAAESVYQAVTGSNGTIGGDLYDATHGGALDIDWWKWLNPAAAAGEVAGKALGPGALNPASDKNLINRGVEWMGGAVTGNEDWTLGGQIYDWTH